MSHLNEEESEAEGKEVAKGWRDAATQPASALSQEERSAWGGAPACFSAA